MVELDVNGVCAIDLFVFWCPPKTKTSELHTKSVAFPTYVCVFFFFSSYSSPLLSLSLLMPFVFIIFFGFFFFFFSILLLY